MTLIEAAPYLSLTDLASHTFEALLEKRRAQEYGRKVSITPEGLELLEEAPKNGVLFISLDGFHAHKAANNVENHALNVTAIALSEGFYKLVDFDPDRQFTFINHIFKFPTVFDLTNLSLENGRTIADTLRRRKINTMRYNLIAFAKLYEQPYVTINKSEEITQQLRQRFPRRYFPSFFQP
jgi:hypothetical protein